ncbi:hypothetical protein ILUMI_12487 [Ignelater luminosus]|uniref:Protein quiver n=1 Tax=Ignelater luminosus TaxID=2038154 RepID=A0A8K0GBR2_IGNLU|nr:hypothetical protein ILUMI_12487 [Ignelater luminosus]
MMSFKLMVFASVFIICNFIKFSESLQCYNCSTKSTWDCGYKFKPSDEVGTVNCPDGVPCLKLKPPVIGGEYDIIQRGCYKQELCTNYSVCFTCDSGDLCNSSVNILPSFTCILLLTTVMCIYKYIIGR